MTQQVKCLLGKQENLIAALQAPTQKLDVWCMTNYSPSTGEGKLADPRGSLLSANLKEMQAPGSERERWGGIKGE